MGLFGKPSSSEVAAARMDVETKRAVEAERMAEREGRATGPFLWPSDSKAHKRANSAKSAATMI